MIRKQERKYGTVVQWEGHDLAEKTKGDVKEEGGIVGIMLSFGALLLRHIGGPYSWPMPQFWVQFWDSNSMLRDERIYWAF